MISWIKLDINILDDAKIKIIRSHPNGDSVVLLWIGLLCLAMKSSRPGTIEISDGLPYTIDDLSNLFNIEKKTVEMGLALFVKYRMIETFEGGTIDVINFSKHQKIEELERKRELTRARTMKYRERLRLCDASPTRGGVTVTLTEEDKEEEKETHLSKKTDKAPVYYSSEFLVFWKEYPNKIGKDAAWKAWRNRNGTRPPLDVLLSALKTQKQSYRWETEGGRYIPNPATWLNQGRWADEVTGTKKDTTWS